MPFANNPGMQLRAAYLSFRRAIQAHCAKFGITSDQLVVLTILAERGGITQKELGERSFADPSTITVMLRLLEKRGLIRRQVHHSDARALRVHISAKGRRLQRDVFAAHLGLIAKLQKGYSKEAAGWLSSVVAEMQASLAAAQTDARAAVQKRRA